MLVSILIPCFNAEKWVAQAIESALAQTWSEKEVIVVDDGSTDNSLEIIRRFDGRIRWESGPNRGGGAARNRLLELASGEWLQYLDADDFLLPQKLERQIEFARLHPIATSSTARQSGKKERMTVFSALRRRFLSLMILGSCWRSGTFRRPAGRFGNGLPWSASAGGGLNSRVVKSTNFISGCWQQVAVSSFAMVASPCIATGTIVHA